MAAPYAPHGLLAKTVRWIRTQANEPTAAKYTDTVLLEFFSQSLAVTLEEVYGMSPAPPYAQYSFTIVAGQQRYMLPANVKEIHRVSKLNATTGLPEWEVVPGSKDSPIGPRVVFEGTTGIRFVPTPQSGLWIGETLTVEYIPGGVLMLHQNLTPVYDTDDDAGTQIATASGLQLSETDGSTSWLVGEFDRRPRAYLGQVVRVLGTVTDQTPSGYKFFPVQERQIQTYTIETGAIAVEPEFDFDFADVTDKQVLIAPPDVAGRTYLLYEIVPDVDSALFWIGAYQAAVAVARAEKREKTATALERELMKVKRGAQLRWSNMEQRVGPRFDTTLDDYYDDGMS